MSNEPDIQDGLATVLDCIQKSGRNVIDEIDDTTEDGEKIEGFVCSHGENNLIVYSTPGSHFFTVQYEYDVTPNAATAQKIQEKINRLPSDISGEVQIDADITNEDITEVRERIAELNKQRDDKQIQKVHTKLVDQLSDPNCGYQIRNDLNGPHGFMTQKKLFAYESDFSPSDFDAACQTIISVAMMPQQFLEDVYNVSVDLPGKGVDDSAGQKTAHRGFQ
ncbi:hypothetical protein [Halorubrum trueperi]|uniref:Uncharacterized protein n=1 Tax=Halorubrum trueperi TaxID=2004704 RepID=A0ABD5UEM8_9EURY